jgi:predicted DsbA family dithiol-disulfide isomerase
MRVDVWSDLVCPWCYVGKRRFERALAAFPHRDAVEVVHRAYLLYAASPRGATFDRRDMLIAKYRLSREQADTMNAGMERTAAAEGLDYHLQGGRTGNTYDAHQLVCLGRDRGRADAVLERLYRAFFIQQRSIFDHASLIELGADAGLDSGDVARVLREDAYATAVDADLDQARAIPVNGVPFFVLDERYAVSGAQQPEVFVEALSRAWADTQAPS